MPDSRTPQPDKESLRTLLLECGFGRVGFAPAGRAPGADHFRRWLERGFAADMRYMERNVERREDPRRVLPGARTVIALALHHDPPTEASSEPSPRGTACIAGAALCADSVGLL